MFTFLRSNTAAAALFLAAIPLADAAIPFTYVDNGTSITITDCPDNLAGPVSIPSMIDGKPVTMIGPNAFAYCLGITSVQVPITVTSIGERAFESCPLLASASLPSSVSSVGHHLFAYCSNLTTVSLPAGITHVPAHAFYRCVRLSSISIPSSVTHIDGGAFSRCRSLETVTLPPKLQVIDNNAFSGSGLTAIEFPKSLTTIGKSAFSYCKNLTEVKLPGNLIELGDWAFAGSALRSADLRSSITSIGDSCFNGCGRLKSVEIPATVTSIGWSAFGSCKALKEVHMPARLQKIGSNAFANSGTKRIYFKGDAPAFKGEGKFYESSRDLKVYYIDGKKGFTYPRWNGRPCRPLGPEIEVNQPYSRSLKSGRSNITFGSLLTGYSQTKTFHIRNIGTQTLRGIKLEVGGSHGRDFSVEQSSTRTLKPGQSVRVHATFHPKSTGPRGAELQIRSNDSNESVFRVKLSGQGMR